MDMSAGSVQADVPAATPQPPETGRKLHNRQMGSQRDSRLPSRRFPLCCKK